MTDQTLEDRVAKLEAEMAILKAERLQDAQLPASDIQPSWKKIIGIFKDDPDFDEAVRLGREWRESFRDELVEDDA